MIAIVDSGSTKADWKFLDTNTDITSLSTMGFNPYFHASEKISLELIKAFDGKLNRNEIKKVFYYGAGCSDDLRCSIVAEGLKVVFPKAYIEVKHDILASARATCKDQPGIACILGTGSNSCAYDGVDLTDNITSLGFLLGDEGSGTHLGKLLIQGYFYREFPDDIKKAFEEELSFDKHVFLNKVYNNDSANVYLASFSKFMSNHKNHIYIQNLVNQAFSLFIKRHVRKYKVHTEVPIHFIGSVAFHFRDILKMVLDERNLELGIVIKKPIDNLVEFHLEKMK